MEGKRLSAASVLYSQIIILFQNPSLPISGLILVVGMMRKQIRQIVFAKKSALINLKASSLLCLTPKI